MSPAAGWHQARQRAHARAEPLRPRRRFLAGALGGVVAEPPAAPGPVPAVDSSAMDGYAVCGDGPWRVVGAVAVGSPDPGRLEPGTAVAVATGSAVPAGTTAVLPYERARRTGEQIGGPAETGRHVRRAGEVVPAGQILAAPGDRVSPVLVALAAGAGIDDLTVRGPVTVDLVLTGEELVTEGLPGPGRVRDAVGPLLSGLIPALGALGGSIARTGDEAEDLLAAVAKGDGEVVVTCGGTSAGLRDRVRPALAQAGAEVIVDGVACRPGHPQLLARLPDGRYLVGLPGNPQAALVAVLTLLEPLLAGLLGLALPDLQRGRLHAAGPAAERVTRLVAARRGPDGWHAVGADGAASLLGASRADVLAAVPPGWNGHEPVPVVPIPGNRR